MENQDFSDAWSLEGGLRSVAPKSAETPFSDFCLVPRGRGGACVGAHAGPALPARTHSHGSLTFPGAGRGQARGEELLL